MKYLLSILTIFLYSCSSNQNTKPTQTAGSIQTVSSAQSRFSSHSTMNCSYAHVSDQFTLDVNVDRYTDTLEYHDSTLLKLLIRNKKNQTSVDSILFSTRLYWGTFLSDCNSVTSYSTNFNSNREIVDNYFGDIVIADVNFDKKDDICFINDNSGNSGPTYNFYVQTADKKFVLDNFLTDSVVFFPDNIDKYKHQLTTLGHAGACCVGQHIFHYDRSTDKWKLISHKILGLPKK
ncbi:MAG: hypothetical protein ABI480_17070 [Chitinophagaceae bacterium]